jgi:uncharacterized protein with PIN domain
MQFKIIELIELEKQFAIKSISDVLKDRLKNTPFKCPKCKGSGYVEKIYNAYPQNLPDSGYRRGVEKIDCDLCGTIGYTNKEYKEITETSVIGYKPIS